MKKIYTLLFAVLVVSSAFAQSTQFQHSKKQATAVQSLTISKSLISKDDSQLKGINAALNQNFDLTVWTPVGWDTIGSPLDEASLPSGWKNSASIDPTWEAEATPSGHFAYFDCFLIPIGGVSSLVTPVLHPVAGDNTLTYKANYFLLNSTYIAAGTALYIEFSTNGGTTWTTSTTNVLATLPSYNTATTGWQTLTVDLATYNGQAVQVRFRAFSDYGGFGLGIDDVTGPEADITIPTAVDIQVVANPQIAMTPVEHAIFAFSADVTNVGSDITTATNLDITATPGGYSDAVAITVPFLNGATETVSSTNYFMPTAVGAYTATFAAPVTGDVNPADNTSSITFAVTDSTWATDNGTITNGIGNTTPITFGNLYAVAAADNITSISVGFNTVTASENFTLSLYTVNTTTFVATAIYTSPVFARTAAMSDVITTFKIANQAVTPGYYFCAINQTGTVNIQAAVDGVAGGQIILLGTGDVLGANSSFGNVFVRMNNGSTGANIKPVEFGKVAVYPNPSNGSLNIVNAPNSNVEVYNLVGKLVYSASNVMSTVDLSSLTNGSYVVKVSTKDSVFNEKINIVK